MAVLSSGSATIVNKMNRAAYKTGLGTEVRRIGLLADASTAFVGSSGSITAGGSRVVISTGLASPKGLIVQCNSSGSCGTLPLYASTGSVAGTYAITSASGVVALGATDVVTWIAFS